MVKKLKVYKINDCDWWCDYSLEEAMNHYREELGYTSEDDEFIFDDPHELTDDELNKYQFVDDNEEKTISSFNDELFKRTEFGFFASTEY